MVMPGLAAPSEFNAKTPVLNYTQALYYCSVAGKPAKMLSLLINIPFKGKNLVGINFVVDLQVGKA